MLSEGNPPSVLLLRISSEDFGCRPYDKQREQPQEGEDNETNLPADMATDAAPSSSKPQLVDVVVDRVAVKGDGVLLRVCVCLLRVYLLLLCVGVCVVRLQW